MGEEIHPMDYFEPLAEHAATEEVTNEELSEVVDLYIYLYDNGYKDYAYAFYSAYATRKLRSKLNKMIEERIHEGREEYI